VLFSLSESDYVLQFARDGVSTDIDKVSSVTSVKAQFTLSRLLRINELRNSELSLL
jgi:hypothetical protein